MITKYVEGDYEYTMVEGFGVILIEEAFTFDKIFDIILNRMMSDGPLYVEGYEELYEN